VLGWAGGLRRDHVDPAPPQNTFSVRTRTKDDLEQLSVSAGLRRVVTRPGAIVDVSLLATVEGGYLHEVEQFTTMAPATGPATTDTRHQGNYAAVTGGIVVERELTDGLALRISTSLLAASWSKVELKDDAGTRNATSGTVSVALAPFLELRLAF